jgi:general secretion pathway protein A
MLPWSGVNVYAPHFGLTAGPFGLTPDPSFLYLSPGHQEALAAVECGLLERRGFVSLVGEVGTGKTTLLYHLLGRIGEQIDVAFVGYTAQPFDDLLAAALRDFGAAVHGGSRHDLVHALNSYLWRRFTEGRAVALVIDEAQDLTDEAFEELRLLSNFETYSQKLLQTVLVGQPELEDRLRRPQLRQVLERVSVRATIDPLSPIEAQRYIAHRLARAGGPRSLFTRAARWLIVRRADGIPRRINILCHNAMLFAYARGLRRVTAAMARRAIAAMDARAERRIKTRRIAGWAAAAAVAVVTVAGGATRHDPIPDAPPLASPGADVPAVAAVPPADVAPEAPPVPAVAPTPPAPPAHHVPARHARRRTPGRRASVPPLLRVPQELLGFLFGHGGHGR